MSESAQAHAHTAASASSASASAQTAAESADSGGDYIIQHIVVRLDLCGAMHWNAGSLISQARLRSFLISLLFYQDFVNFWPFGFCPFARLPLLV
eukprot:m.110053 g.110053  ORF g.110053 m.110053 type:complete len:95 (-) comp51789_c0_seq3:384-668(-)